MSEVFRGVKMIQIHAQTRYPIVSAFEFEFLKSEAEIRALLKPCTIYFILQRPLLYFTNVRPENGEVTFDITDDSINPPLRCKLDPAANGLSKPGEDFQTELQFYKKTRDEALPFNDVAAIKFLTVENKFLGWYSPAKFLYEFLAKTLKAQIEGDISQYLDYTVHYIGRAFSQDIWNRLTGHHAMQKIS